MSRLLAITADHHIGNHHIRRKIGGEMVGGLNARCWETLRATDAAWSEIGDLPWVIAGDLFDVSDPSPEIIAHTMFSLPESVRIIVGNHDQTSDEHLHHAIAPLSKQHLVYEQPTCVPLPDPNYRLLMVPFLRAPAVEVLRDAFEMAKQVSPPHPTLAVAHMGIKDESTPPWLASSEHAIHVDELAKLMDEYGIDDFAAGDWHEHKVWKRGDHHIAQVGALCPTGWDNPGLEGYGSVLYWLNSGGFERVEIPGPRFLKGDDVDVPDRAGYTYYRKVVAGSVQEAKELATNPLVEVGIDMAATAMAGAKAARAARSQTTQLEAIDAYCRAKFGERSPAVLEYVKECLSEATTA